MNRVRRVELVIVAALTVTTAAAGALGAWRASAAAPLPPDLTGPCSVEARIDPGGVVIDPAVSSGVYVLPVDGTVTYRATIGGPAIDGPRPLRGRVAIDLPAPLPDPVVADWDETGSLADNTGTASYRLGRWWAPSGAVVVVRAEHREPGAVCAGSLTVRLGGSGLPMRSLLVGLLLCSAALTARAVRPSRAAGTAGPWDPPAPAAASGRFAPAGRPGLGLVAGAVHGVTASSLLVLAGTFGLASSWVLAGPVLGAAVGLALGWWAPGATDDHRHAGRRERGRPEGGDEGPDLPLIDPV